MTIKNFQRLYDHVSKRIGNDEVLAAMLPVANTSTELCAQTDNYYLSSMGLRIFRAGLKHSIVDAKWPAFEQAFFDFNLQRVAMMSDDDMDALMANRQIIRHWGKLKSLPINAGYLLQKVEQHGSVGQWLAQWPSSNIVGLWSEMKKQGSHLGGNSAAYFLRMAGKDTFLLTEDVVVALKAQGLITKRPTSIKDLNLVQEAFNSWQQQSGRPLCQISRLLSLTVNY